MCEIWEKVRACWSRKIFGTNKRQMSSCHFDWWLHLTFYKLLTARIVLCEIRWFSAPSRVFVAARDMASSLPSKAVTIFSFTYQSESNFPFRSLKLHRFVIFPSFSALRVNTFHRQATKFLSECAQFRQSTRSIKPFMCKSQIWHRTFT